MAEETEVQPGGGAAHEPEVTVEETVLVAPGSDAGATARALLDAATGDYEVRDVQWSDGNFVVPAGLADAAVLPEDGDNAEPTSDNEDDSYDKWTVAELKAEIEARNESRDDDTKIPTDGKKADLVAALEADDADGDNAE